MKTRWFISPSINIWFNFWLKQNKTKMNGFFHCRIFWFRDLFICLLLSHIYILYVFLVLTILVLNTMCVCRIFTLSLYSMMCVCVYINFPFMRFLYTYVLNNFRPEISNNNQWNKHTHTFFPNNLPTVKAIVIIDLWKLGSCCYICVNILTNIAITTRLKKHKPKQMILLSNSMITMFVLGVCVLHDVPGIKQTKQKQKCTHENIL